MDNLQETAIYLAAMLDGEGSICIRKRILAKGKYNQLSSLISYSNTDERIIGKLRAQLDYVGIHYHVYSPKSLRPTNQRRFYVIEVWRLTEVKKLVDILLQSPFLAKREECELVLEFVQSRLGEDGLPFPKFLGIPYSNRAWEIKDAIEHLGNHRKSRMPQRPYVLPLNTVDDMAHTTMKVVD